MSKEETDTDQEEASECSPDSGRNRDVPAESSEMARAFWSSMQEDRKKRRADAQSAQRNEALPPEYEICDEDDPDLIEGCFGPTLEESEEIMMQEDRRRRKEAEAEADEALVEMYRIDDSAVEQGDHSVVMASSRRTHVAIRPPRK